MGCNFYIHVDNGEIKGLSPSWNHPVNEGGLCIKGWHAYQSIQHPERLKKPLLKKGNNFVEISWDEALDMAKAGFERILKEHGPNSLALIGSARCTNEENFLMQKFARVVFGTHNVDHCARICHGPTVVGLRRAFGSGAMTNPIADIEKADFLLVVGSNTTVSHPLIARRMVRALKKGAQIAVVDPVKTGIARLAYYYLPLSPGSDIPLFMGMAKVILEKGLHNREFIEKYTEGFEEFKRELLRISMDEVVRITGVPKDLIEEVAVKYATSRASSIVYCLGVTEHITGTENVMSLANLALLTGHIGREGTGVNPLRGQNNVQGASDLGVLADSLPGYKNPLDPTDKEPFEREWGVNLSTTPGLAIPEFPQAIEEGKIRGMYIIGEDPALTDPDTSKVQSALSKLEFLVVQDVYMTETASLANIVLPAALWAEKDGTFTNTERRIQRIRKVVDPPGEAKPDWEILTLLAGRMGYDWNYNDPSEIMDEIARLVPLYGGISYDRLKEGWGISWPVPDRNHPGTPRLYEDLNFKTKSGKGVFNIVRYRPPFDVPDDEYPLYLTTGRHGFHWHVASMTGRSPTLKREYPRSYVLMNRKDMERFNLKRGDRVKIISRRGKIEAFIEEGEPKPGVLFMPLHFKEAPVNILTPAVMDPLSRMPDFKGAAVRLEKCNEEDQ